MNIHKMLNKFDKDVAVIRAILIDETHINQQSTEHKTAQIILATTVEDIFIVKCANQVMMNYDDN